MEATDTQAMIPNTDEPTEPTAAPTADTFCIDSMGKLEWYLRKVGNLEAEKARIKAQAAAMIAQLDTDLQGLTTRFSGQAEQFTRDELDRRGGRRKSLTTLQGTCAFRTSPPRLTVADNDAAMVRAHAMHLTTATICTGAYLDAAKKALEETGELLPGVEMLDARETFRVSFKGDTGSAEEGA